MSDDRARYGPLIATASAAVLAVSVFLPWYGVSMTANGTAYFQQVTEKLAAQYGNAALQSEVGGLNTHVSSLAGHEVATLSAHQALKHIGVALLLLAGVAFLLALLRLADSPRLPSARGASIAWLGVLATICVLYRMAERPSAPGGEEYFSLSLHYGAWLALVTSLGVVLGGAWSGRVISSQAGFGRESEALWSTLSGWTPDG
jgi:hypothetical protein